MVDSGEQLELVYTALSLGLLWDENPKEHDLQLLVDLIWKYGFRDPPHFSEDLGGFDEGNGRTTALWVGREQGREPPNGVYVREDGEWMFPVLYGMDFADKIKAKAWAIDHNNSNLMSITGMTPLDASRAWDTGAYLAMLQEVCFETRTVDPDDLVLMKKVIDSGYTEETLEKYKEDRKEPGVTEVKPDREQPAQESAEQPFTMILKFANREDLLDLQNIIASIKDEFPGPSGTTLLSYIMEYM